MMLSLSNISTNELMATGKSRNVDKCENMSRQQLEKIIATPSTFSTRPVQCLDLDLNLHSYFQPITYQDLDTHLNNYILHQYQTDLKSSIRGSNFILIMFQECVI